MKIKINYFKQNGTWYTCGEFETELENGETMYDIVKKIKSMNPRPGLSTDGKYFYAVITTNNEELQTPYLIPAEYFS